MTPKKKTKENFPKDGIHVERGTFAEANYIIRQGKKEKDMGFHYIFKASLEKYYNQWCPILIPRKEWGGSLVLGNKRFF